MLFNKRTVPVLLFGFFSGLPLMLTSSTLQAWFTVNGVSLKEIGALSLVSMPYLFNFLWAPLIDRFIPPWLGRRRSWIVLAQFGVAFFLCLLAFLTPGKNAALIGVVAVMIAFFSASQDIAINAYQTENLLEHERALGASFFVFSYRIAIFVSGGLALIIAEYFQWKVAYLLMSLLMLLGMVATVFSPEKEVSQLKPRTLQEAVAEPWREFLSRKDAWIFLLFIALYKLSDAFGLSLNTTFLIRELNFTLVDIGVAYKVTAVIATILGSFLAGWIMTRWGLFKSLFYFGILQALSLLSFVGLAYIGHNIVLMVAAIFIDFFTSGMGTIAFFALLMGLCNQRYTATQFALFSALASLGRVLVGPGAAAVVEKFNWIVFYYFAIVLAIPGLLLLLYLNHRGYFQGPQVIMKNKIDAGRLSRISWQCRRGLLELDILLQTFFKSSYATLSPEQKEAFERFLKEPDPRLLSWLSGTDLPEDPEFLLLVEKILEANE